MEELCAVFMSLPDRLLVGDVKKMKMKRTVGMSDDVMRIESLQAPREASSPHYYYCGGIQLHLTCCSSLQT